jgi:hypothetical protein
MAATQLRGEELQRLARMGAATRLEQIERERLSILRAFPDLARRRPARTGEETADADGAGAAPAKRTRRRRRNNMSAEARRAVSERMKKYWADRRKKKTAKA